MSDNTVADQAEPPAQDETTNTHAAEAPAQEAAPEPQPEQEVAPQEPEAEQDGFAALGLSEPILKALHEKGYLNPTPIQAQAIPVVLMGQDVLGCAQTGTGKTAGFTLPMLDILSGSRARARMPRSLILEPTRELALQVAENFVQYGKYLKLNHALLIGGESMSDQKEVLSKGVDVLIATPGRLIDLFERGGLLLTDVRVLVIDEADRMLDMGFIPDIERIVSMLPANRQTLFFSATMAPEIRRLADAFLTAPKEITVSKPATVATTITSGLVLVNEHDKREALRRLIRSDDVQNAIIFCNRKRDVDILLKSLLKHGFAAGALHGDLPQSVRFATLEKFKAGELKLLACSDVAARGIDIGGLSHVFNFDVPHHAEDYVHRIGRTGRAGREGHAYTIATPDDRLAVEAVEKLTGAPIPRIEIPGLDVVEWAEGDGRKRGRGGRVVRGGDKKGVKEKPAAREAKPQPERAPKPEAPREREAAREREAPRERDRERPRRERERDREPRYDRDLGAPVLGFGETVPAFMLIRRRGATPVVEDVNEEEAPDVIPEENGGNAES
ncbi:DEAD/DEAH box helicase [Acidocella aromatica]|uniref:DEAD-box ATP-dependent RNA helicase RhpA n=1 Tax=Acidocella aromatica TaxID=1303579 RepID=A0A840VLB4_9PROT|nr:DEAD/DEAH box helicase [Acidocella aromatica]MBB5372999.1 superfamily II DNA/RNA helicase [Acidocella aromatica]